MPITEAAIVDALRTVDDPDLKKDLISLNMVKDIKINVNEVSFTVVLTTPACPLKELIRKSCEEAVHKLVSSELKVDITMTADVTSSRRSEERRVGKECRSRWSR